MTVVRSAVSKEWLDEWNKEGHGYELGCDSSSMWDTYTTDCFCEESKCNGSSSVAAAATSLLMALALAFGLISFGARPM